MNGEFGITYEGFLEDGQTVAIKRYNKDANIVDEFRNEIQILTKFHSDYLVSVIGKCEESQEMILVHEFMKNGTLADHIFSEDSTPLSWEQRLRICIDAAQGLEYLHNGTGNTKRIIHRNINPANILLDEYWSAKISEFGYAKLGPANTKNSAVKTDVKGTSAYLDPYYNLTGQLTRRTDVYAFGVVLFDVLFGRPAFDGLDQKHRKLGQWTQQCLTNGTIDQIVDKRLKGQISPECLKEFVQVASSCLLDNPINRPTMSQVVEKLQSILKLSLKTHPST